MNLNLTVNKLTNNEFLDPTSFADFMATELKIPTVKSDSYVELIITKSLDKPIDRENLNKIFNYIVTKFNDMLVLHKRAINFIEVNNLVDDCVEYSVAMSKKTYTVLTLTVRPCAAVNESLFELISEHKT